MKGGLAATNPSVQVWEAALAVPFAAFLSEATQVNARIETASGYQVMGHPGIAPNGYADYSYRRKLSRERTSAGLVASRSRGRSGGRPPKLSERQLAMARKLLSDPATRIDDVCRKLRVSRSTIYRRLHPATTSTP